MATQKTLAPTNQTITIAGFQGEKPDQQQIADAETKMADAINALNSQLIVGGNALADADLAKTTGMYYIGSSTANRPEQYCTLYVFAASANTTLTQFAISLFTRKVYIRSYANGAWSDWRLISEPDLTNGEKTVSSIAAGAIATGYVDVQFPSGRTRAMSAFPAYTTSGLPIVSVYLDSGAATGYQRVQFAVRNVTSAAVTNEKVTIKVMFV